MDPSLKTKFNEITSRDYAGQAKWFLNGFWETDGKSAEQIWEFVQLCILIDHRKGKVGNELDELEAHRFLEQLGETLTVADMRNKLREIDIDFNKRMALIEYLIFKYNKGVVQVINAHQGGVETRRKIEEAEKLVAAANQASDELAERLEQERQALAYAKLAATEALRSEAAARDRENEAVEAENQAREREAAATSRENSAKEREAAAAAREEDARRADDENKAALNELHKQEKEFNDKKADLLSKSTNESLGGVARGKAKNELEQLKSTDPLPLQRAKINQSATVRKSERAHLDAEAARSLAESSRLEATKSRKEAEKARKDAEDARVAAQKAVKQAEAARKNAEQKAYEADLSVQATAIAAEDARRKLQEAVDALEELKKIPDQSFGDIWWMERELAERKKYLPKSRQ